MARCSALYRDPNEKVIASVVLTEVSVILSTNPAIELELSQQRVQSGDAIYLGRFVRAITFATSERIVLISPPGAIAPRVARLPHVQGSIIELESRTLWLLEQWLQKRLRLAECTLLQLARFAELAEESYAAELGESYARAVLDGIRVQPGGLRNPLPVPQAFQFLRDVASRSIGGRAALLSALAVFSGCGESL